MVALIAVLAQDYLFSALAQDRIGDGLHLLEEA
jgi:hypothetical protein